MDKARLEAFSDGVLAIAITLLIIEVRVPQAGPGELWSEIVNAWPQFAAYLVSFFVIGIMWVNHHSLIGLVTATDRLFLFFNLFLLLFIVTIPFTTALLADYIRKDAQNAHVAAAIYSASLFGCAVGFQAMWRWVAGRGGLAERMPASVIKTTNFRFGIGFLIYLATIGLSFVDAVLTLGVHFLIAVYYMFDQLVVRRHQEAKAR